MTELKLADTVNYKAALMALINAIINCTQDLLHRNRIRNEFVGMSHNYQLVTLFLTVQHNQCLKTSYFTKVHL